MAFDAQGRLAATGNRRGTIEKLLYESGQNGKLLGAADRNDNQVVWYEYNGDNKISAVRDCGNRRVEYTYTNGNLTKIKDVLGNNTLHEYDANERLTKTTDAAGRQTIVAYDNSNVKSVEVSKLHLVQRSKQKPPVAIYTYENG